MLCQNCKKNQASTHITQTINGVQHEYYLCAQCAAQKGYAFTDGLNFAQLLGSLFGNVSAHPASFSSAENPSTVRCPTCGASFAEIAGTGKLGCAACYSFFGRQLLPSIERIHGRSSHVGKVPGKPRAAAAPPEAPAVAPKSHKEELEEELAAAVEAQEYEKAAELRDAIKALE